MRRSVKRLLYGVVWLFLLCQGITANAKPLVLGADPWCPMICADDPAVPGFLVEMAQVALSKHGYEVRYQNLPWSRALLMVESGEIDGLLGANKSRESIVILPKEAYFFTVTGYAAHRRLENYKWAGDSNLAGIRLVLIQDYDYAGTTSLGPWLANHSSQTQYVKGDDPLPRVLGMIERDRGDLTIDNLAVLQYNLKKAGLTNNFSTGPVGDMHRSFIGISRKNPEAKTIEKLLNLEIPLMRANGVLKVILDKYGVKDWQ